MSSRSLIHGAFLIQYSFFSHVHHSLSCIDYFLLDNRLLQSVQSCSYDTIVISDQAPTTLELFVREHEGTCPPWRFNTRLLSNEDFKFVSNQMKFFLITNRTPGISAYLLWGTLKANIRGEIISYSSYENKQRKTKLKRMKVTNPPSLMMPMLPLHPVSLFRLSLMFSLQKRLRSSYLRLNVAIMNRGISRPNFWPISSDRLPPLSRFHTFKLPLAHNQP